MTIDIGCLACIDYFSCKEKQNEDCPFLKEPDYNNQGKKDES